MTPDRNMDLQELKKSNRYGGIFYIDKSQKGKMCMSLNTELQNLNKKLKNLEGKLNQS